jgi:hypothetical protein
MSELSEADQTLLNQGIDPEEAKAETPEAKADDPLELGSEEAPKATEEEIAADKEKKTRSHSLTNRVNMLTARLREAERRAAEAEAKATPQATETTAEAPDPQKYEFGEADPQFLKDFARHEARKIIAEEREAVSKKDAEAAKQNEAVQRLQTGMANLEKTGTEKYSDFADKIAEAVEARDGEPLPPLISVGIAVSPAGADIAYRLATDTEASDKLEELAKTDPQKAALAFGELEGEYVDDDSDLNLSDQADMLRMLGRMRARLNGKGGVGKTAAVKTTKAPKPAEHQARGSTGQFEVSDDTNDFAAFEKKYAKGT